MEQKRYPEGHFIGLGIAIGISLGVPIGLALGNMILGPTIGFALGITIGIALERKNNPNPRPLTKEEKKNWKRSLTILLGLGVMLFLAFTISYFLLK